ncbi:MAG: hypothetical protein JW722_02750 [Demequinaceae bacterium]|nr:hypothetical protein [Demequinaceae bacterium]
MKDAAKRSASPVESNPNPLLAFSVAHPGAIWTIAKGAGIGAAVGLGVGLGLPGRGAFHRAAVALLFALAIALIGGLIAAARAIPHDHGGVEPEKEDWAAKVEAKMKSGSSNPVPRRVAQAKTAQPKKKAT